MTEKLDHYRLFMKGTRKTDPRCVALQGTVGTQVHCSIYDRRSSVCRDFPVAWENGAPNERCDKARIAWGLAPINPSSSNNPDNFEKVA
jgi:Fe-S-cluster containining protein